MSKVDLVKFGPKNEHGSYPVHYENEVFLGDLVVGDDGYYCWFPPYPSNGGAWSSHVIRAIADKIDELDKPWDEEVNRYFELDAMQSK